MKLLPTWTNVNFQSGLIAMSSWGRACPMMNALSDFTNSHGAHMHVVFQIWSLLKIKQLKKSATWAENFYTTIPCNNFEHAS